jgi:ribonuclease P protein component
MLARALRLKEKRQFQAVYRRGRSWSNRQMALHILSRPTAEKRFGFVVGKKLGGAVQRNRVRRLLREACRALAPNVAPGVDVVIVGRAEAAQALLMDLVRGMQSLFERSGFWVRDEASVDGATPLEESLPPRAVHPGEAREKESGR